MSNPAVPGQLHETVTETLSLVSRNHVWIDVLKMTTKKITVFQDTVLSNW
jgi:hypothetical protein